jgi:hypothetical protein
VDKGVARLCKLNGLRFMKINSNWGLWLELEEILLKNFIDGWTLEHEGIMIQKNMK